MPSVREPQRPGGIVPKPGCDGYPGNCELLSRLNEDHAERCRAAGIIGPDALLCAAAVGLVIEVWRNSPVEDMHASRRGPSDAGMFAESTALQTVAVTALTAPNRKAGLLDFEEHLLDRERPWAGTGGRTLSLIFNLCGAGVDWPISSSSVSWWRSLR